MTWVSLMSIGALEIIPKTGPLMEQDATERISKTNIKKDNRINSVYHNNIRQICIGNNVYHNNITMHIHKGYDYVLMSSKI